MRKPLLRFFIVFSLVLLVLTACDHNVYMEEPEKVDGLWKVNGIYFDSLQEAMDYIYGTTKGLGNSKAIEDVPITRIAVLQRNVYNGERGGGLIVPADFEGQLVIDFNGFTYEFDNSLDHFFDIRGGDEVYIINGTTVIYNEADHRPFALAVNTDTVTIDDHLIDDRRWDPTNNKSDAKLFNVGTKGSLVVRDIPSSGIGVTLTGVIAIATDGIENGGKIQITNSTLVISNIFTTYQDSEGNIKDKIPSDVDIPEEAKSRIDILSGNIEIQNLNQGTDYFDGATLYLKAILNIIKADPDNPERDTIVLNPHSIDTIIEAVVESVTDPEKKAEKIIIHDFGDWHTTMEPTCTEEGSHWRRCQDPTCNLGPGGEPFIEEEAIPALGHDMTYYDAVAPTCTEDGMLEHYHCSRCGKNFKDEAGENELSDIVIPAPGHDWQELYTPEKHWHECSRCHEKKDEAQHQFTILFKPGTTVNTVVAITACEVCEYSATSSSIPSSTGAFSLTQDVGGLSAVRTDSTHWTIYVSDEIKNMYDSCKWFNADCSEVIEGTTTDFEPLALEVAVDEQISWIRVYCMYYDDQGVLKAGGYVFMHK